MMLTALSDLVTFWAGKQAMGLDGTWCHEFDRKHLANAPKGLILEFPVSPFIGDILQAPIVILNLNGGFNPTRTPQEFADDGSIDRWLGRVADPSNSDWSDVSTYYDDTNYGHLIPSRKAVVINACAYRSKNLEKGSPERALAESLPSVRFHRRWLREVLIPEANAGRKIIVANRWGLWDIKKPSFPNVIFDPTPDGANLSRVTQQRVGDKLAELAL